MYTYIYMCVYICVYIYVYIYMYVDEYVYHPHYFRAFQRGDPDFGRPLGLAWPGPGHCGLFEGT